jgi:putative SOS response-associated peptidase YedK
MCGRYTLFHHEADICAAFGLDRFPWLPRYNLAPTQLVPILRLPPGSDAGLERVDARWGLIPRWAVEASEFKMLLFNARSETVAEKPAFRDAARSARCAFPASGFYEWRLFNGRKRPYFIQRRDGAPLLFAGLYAERAHGEPRLSATILTTDANALMRPLHERMPVILEPDKLARWLDPRERDIRAFGDLFAPRDDEVLEAYPVDIAVGNARIDDPGLVQRSPDVVD